MLFRVGACEVSTTIERLLGAVDACSNSGEAKDYPTERLRRPQSWEVRAILVRAWRVL